MWNCPGREGATGPACSPVWSAAGSTTRVRVSAVSWMRSTTRCRTGAMGAVVVVTAVPPRCPVQVEQLGPGLDQPAGDHPGQPPGDLGVQAGPGLQHRPQRSGLQHHGGGVDRGHGVDLPLVGREHPRPPHHAARLHRGEHHVPRRGRWVSNEIRPSTSRCRPSAGSPSRATRCRALTATTRPHAAMASRSSSARPAVNGWSASSSRTPFTALPPPCRGPRSRWPPRPGRWRPGTRRCTDRTPRTPTVSNWSHHVESLWVSHWR